MVDLSDLALFLVTGLVLTVTLGPDRLYIAARSTSEGRRAGVVSALGIVTGCLVHIVAATAGLSALLVASALAFEVVRWLGVAYLVFLGIRALLFADRGAGTRTVERASLGSIYREGVLVNVFNPKVALFFLSVLPQFVDPAMGSVGVQIALLGVLFNGTGTLVKVAVALGLGSAGAWLAARPKVRRVQGWATGLTCIGLGVVLVLSKRR